MKRAKTQMLAGIAAVLLILAMIFCSASFSSLVKAAEPENSENMQEMLLEEEEDTLRQEEALEEEPEIPAEEVIEEAIPEETGDASEEAESGVSISAAAADKVVVPTRTDYTCTYTKAQAIAAADAVTGDHLINIQEKDNNYEAVFGTKKSLAANTAFDSLVQYVFTWIRDNGDGGLYRVVIPKGSYTFKNEPGWNVYSNTVIDCRSGAQIQSGTESALLVRCGRKDDAETGAVKNAGGYDDYKNIMILGGTWKGRKDVYGCNIRFGHATNIYLLDMTIKDNYGSEEGYVSVSRGHHIEIGGVSGMLISGCDISGSNGCSLEAIQIDVVHRNYGNFTGYYPYDDLPTCNLTVDRNTIHDVSRGIGSHHVVMGRHYDGIRITNNTFKNIKDRAVLAVYFTNSKIIGNQITNAYAGIESYVFLRNHNYLPNGVTKGTVESVKANLVISENDIWLNRTNTSTQGDQKFGIRLLGGEVTSSNNAYSEKVSVGYNYDKGKTEKKKLAVGMYYLTHVTVNNNKIHVYNAAGKTSGNINTGIYINNIKSTSISGNYIDLGNCTAESTFGISLRHSKSIKVTGNTVKNIAKSANGDGIYVREGCEGVSVIKNKVLNVSAYGIYCKSKVSSIKQNVVKKAGLNGIYIQNAKTNASVIGNTVTNAGGCGIMVNTGSAGVIKLNKATNVKRFGIEILDASVTHIVSNTIKKAGIDKKSSTGIRLAGGTAKSIKSNTIAGVGKTRYGIRLMSGSKCIRIENNKISKLLDARSSYGIRLDGSNAKAVLRNILTGKGRDIVYIGAGSKVGKLRGNKKK